MYRNKFPFVQWQRNDNRFLPWMSIIVNRPAHQQWQFPYTVSDITISQQSVRRKPHGTMSGSLPSAVYRA